MATVIIACGQWPVKQTPPSAPSTSPRGLDGGDVDLPHGHHRLEGALCLVASGGKRLGQRTWGDLPGESPAILAPAARAFLSAIAHDGVPVAVGFFLVVRGDLERESFAVRKDRAAVETETGDSQHGELHREHVAFLAAGIVGGRLMYGRHRAIREGSGVELRRLVRVLVVPE